MSENQKSYFFMSKCHINMQKEILGFSENYMVLIFAEDLHCTHFHFGDDGKGVWILDLRNSNNVLE